MVGRVARSQVARDSFRAAPCELRPLRHAWRYATRSSCSRSGPSGWPGGAACRRRAGGWRCAEGRCPRTCLAAATAAPSRSQSWAPHGAPHAPCDWTCINSCCTTVRRRAPLAEPAFKQTRGEAARHGRRVPAPHAHRPGVVRSSTHTRKRARPARGDESARSRPVVSCDQGKMDGVPRNLNGRGADRIRPGGALRSGSRWALRRGRA
jgi:hypothetical protein